jgi:hypothetical protein
MLPASGASTSLQHFQVTISAPNGSWSASVLSARRRGTTLREQVERTQAEQAQRKDGAPHWQL